MCGPLSLCADFTFIPKILATDFPGKRCWLLNTLKNVKVLERHVGKEVHHYMKERDTGTGDQVNNPHYVESEGFLEKQWLPEETRKVCFYLKQIVTVEYNFSISIDQKQNVSTTFFGITECFLIDHSTCYALEKFINIKFL